MLIKTKEFNITPQELRRLITSIYFQQRRIILLLYAATTVLILLSANNEFGRLLSIYLIVSFIYMMIVPFLINFKKTMPVCNFIARYWEIDEEFICIYYEDGSLTKFRFEHLINVVKQQEFYCLYLTAAGQLNYLPVSAFESEKDIHRFELLLEGKQLIKLWK